MKKIIATTIALAAALILGLQFTSCEKYILPELSFSPDTLLFSPGSGSLYVEVTSNVAWETKYENEVEWLTNDPTNFEGDTTVCFKVSANETEKQRTASINIQSESIRKALVIIQEATVQPAQ